MLFDTDLPRGPQAHALAARVLRSLFHELGSMGEFLVVVGGLVPSVLTRDQEPPAPPHLGTQDVDVVLTVHLHEDKLGTESLERALGQLKFEPDPSVEGWRWRARVDGNPVKLEFLCDLENELAGSLIHPPGCVRLSALNLRGTGYAERDWTLEVLEGPLIDSTTKVRVSVRFASLQAFLLSKVHAIISRGLEKDYYDFAYVIIHNREGGPSQVGQSLKTGKFAEDVRGMTLMWNEIADRFGSSDRIGPQAFSDQSIQADPALEAATLRQDAVRAVELFLAALRRT